MTLVKQLNELLPQCDVKVMEYRTEKYGSNVYLSYKIELYWEPHITLSLCLSLQVQFEDDFSKNTLPQPFSCSCDYDLISEFDFNALSEFVKAHQGEWTSIGNII
jgi:hypothetical protein